MKQFVILLSVVFFLSCSGRRDQSRDSIKPKVIRIAYQLGHLPDMVAKNNKFFEEEFKKDSIKIEYKKFDFGPAVSEAFVTKSVDIGTLGDQPAIVGWAKGADIKIVGNLTGGGDKMALLVPPGSTVKSFKDLKGKKIALTIGANTHHLFHILLKEAGFQQSQVQVVNLPFSGCVTALSQNRVDATILSEPYISLILNKQYGKVVRFSRELKYVTLPIVASNEFIRNHPDLLIRLLSVYYRANVWAIHNQRETATILFREENGLLPLDVDLKLVDKYTENYGLNDSAIAAFSDTYQYLLETNVIQHKLDFKDLYVTKFDIASQKK
jgi:sulfonate transport system substrate-binding protein